MKSIFYALLLSLLVVLMFTALGHCQCTNNNGTPCAKWVTKLVGQYPPAPEPQKIHYDLPPAKFFSIRRWDQPVRPISKKSWIIWSAAHAAGWIALATTNHKTEGWHSEAPALGGVTFMDFMVLKYMSPSMSFEGGVYAAQHYIRSR